MSGPVKVTIVAPAKIGTRWYRPGDGAEVAAEDLAELVAAGVIAADPGAEPVVTSVTYDARLYTADEWDAAVAEAAKALAEALVPGIVEKAVEDLTAERDGAIERAQEAEAERDRLRIINADLEARIAGASTETGADGKGEADATVPAAKTSPKGRAAKG